MVGLLIITHNNVGQALFDAATSVLGGCPMPYKILTISQDCEPEEKIDLAAQYLEQLKQNEGILVITDMYGSTPSNIASKLAAENVIILSGINLPMMVRIMNYPQLSVEKLAHKAVSGGQAGIIILK